MGFRMKLFKGETLTSSRETNRFHSHNAKRGRRGRRTPSFPSSHGSWIAPSKEYLIRWWPVERARWRDLLVIYACKKMKDGIRRPWCGEERMKHEDCTILREQVLSLVERDTTKLHEDIEPFEEYLVAGLERCKGAFLFVLSHSCEARKDRHRRPWCEERMNATWRLHRFF
jgi:hypothetical protein